jgi:hypothetical protein
VHCDECDFEYGDLPEEQIGHALRAVLPQYGTILADDEAPLTAHPVEGTWSVLEYACHLRDIFDVQRERVELALKEDEPTFVPMGRDERAVNDRYNEQDPKEVGRELIVAGRALATLFESLDDAQLQRTGIYNYPEPMPRTIGWIGVHTVHEARHHLQDIEHLLDAAGGAGR